MKIHLLFAFLIINTSAVGQTSAPKKINFVNSILHFNSATDTITIKREDSQFAKLYFSYDLQTTKASIRELDRQIALLVKKLKPAVEAWKQRNTEYFKVRVEEWKYYEIFVSMHGEDVPWKNIFVYLVNADADTISSKYAEFSRDNQAQKFKYIYGTSYLTRLTSISTKDRKVFYESILKKIHSCAKEKVPDMLMAYDEKPPTKDEMEYWYRIGKRHHYLTCFRQLAKTKFKTANNELLDALFMELGLWFGDEDNFENRD